jgi:hypothetical protein
VGGTALSTPRVRVCQSSTHSCELPVAPDLQAASNRPLVHDVPTIKREREKGMWFPPPPHTHLRVPCLVQPSDFLAFAITSSAPRPRTGLGVSNGRAIEPGDGASLGTGRMVTGGGCEQGSSSSVRAIPAAPMLTRRKRVTSYHKQCI